MDEVTPIVIIFGLFLFVAIGGLIWSVYDSGFTDWGKECSSNIRGNNFVTMSEKSCDTLRYCAEHGYNWDEIYAAKCICGDEACR
jgi:hypothetical protein